jgi:hypothetical protein
MSKIKEIDEEVVRSIRNQQEIIKQSLNNPDIRTSEVRGILQNSLMELEDQIREITGGGTKHAKGGAVMKKRGGTFKGTF